MAADNGDLVELAHLDGDVAEGGEQAASSVANNGLDVTMVFLQLIYGRLVKEICLMLERSGEEVGAAVGVLDHHHAEAAPKIGAVQQGDGHARQVRRPAGGLGKAVKMPLDGFGAAMMPEGQLSVALLSLQIALQQSFVRRAKPPVSAASASPAAIPLNPASPSILPKRFSPAKRAVFLIMTLFFHCLLTKNNMYHVSTPFCPLRQLWGNSVMLRVSVVNLFFWHAETRRRGGEGEEKAES
jgi:hypothetical protein